MADFTVTSLGNGVYCVSDGGRRQLAYAAGSADERWVFLNGSVHVFEAEASPATTARKKTDDHATLAAPMPATVVTIAVEPGQRVSKGDVLIVLEAMKMELSIKAPRDGSVKAIACRPGELVQPGVPLMELA